MILGHIFVSGFCRGLVTLRSKYQITMTQTNCICRTQEKYAKTGKVATAFSEPGIRSLAFSKLVLI